MKRRLSLGLLVACLLLGLIQPVLAAPASQQPSIDELVANLKAHMSPDDKIGQLFVVGFQGTQLDATTTEWINRWRVGGMVLSVGNDNFTSGDLAAHQVISLTRGLQEQAFQSSQAGQPSNARATSQPPAPPFIPLLIGVTYDGDSYPYSGLHAGLTPLPNDLALGATWNPDQAQSIGEILGSQLASQGINLLIGPSLDVLDHPHPTGNGDPGTRVFGGDPFWVGQMGQAFTRGLHNGSQGRLAVIASHFPGLGAADADADHAVTTVEKSLEQLQQIELAPYLAVTAPAKTDPASSTDGLQTAFVRYQGFRGNLRAFTNPVVFDSTTLDSLLAIDKLAAWRQAGGVIMSARLGAEAVRETYGPTPSYPELARDAFLAGNDLLLFSDAGLQGGPAGAPSVIQQTIQYFRQEFQSDTNFQRRVDDSVERILRLKLKLYGDFTRKSVFQPDKQPQSVPDADSRVVGVARAAASQIWPTAQVSGTLVSPRKGEPVIVFTDQAQSQACSICPPQPVLAQDALRQAILNDYGPAANGPISPTQVTSFTFGDLKTMLRPRPPTPATPPSSETATPSPSSTQAVGTAFSRARWVILAMLDAHPSGPDSDAVHLLLSEHSELVAGKQVLAISFGAPTSLSRDEINLLTAYYALYSPAPPFVDAAARLLFGDLRPQGASPLSIPAVGYDLNLQTQPDPNQVIQLSLGNTPAGQENAPTPTPLALAVGRAAHVQTGVIVDHNGNPVPDGTPVQFMARYTEGNDTPTMVMTMTTNGIAEADIPLAHEGTLGITASSDSAERSVTLEVAIIKGKVPAILTVVPTAEHTTAAPTRRPSPTPSPDPTATATPAGNGPKTTATLHHADGSHLLWALVGLLLLGLVAYRVPLPFRAASRWRPVWLTWMCGLIGFNYAALGLPMVSFAAEALGSWTAVLLAWLGGLVALGLLVLMRTRNRRSPAYSTGPLSSTPARRASSRTGIHS